ncbi:MAG: InlB B-repeat-containing protein [Clostridia bacterium]|nr:InlB B-repeat-containing protein [Clostridia bacterium]
MKKFLSILLAVVLVLSTFTVGFAGAVDMKVNETTLKTKSKGIITLSAAPADEQYAWGDEVVFNVDVTNNTGTDYENVKVRAQANKAKFFYDGESNTVAVGSIKAGETQTIQISVKSSTPGILQRLIVLPIYYILDFFSPMAFKASDYDTTALAKVGVFRYKFGFDVTDGSPKQAKPTEPDKPDVPVEPDKEVTISFNLNYAGAPATIPAQTVKAGEKAVAVTAPVRSGYTFMGWFTNPSCAEEYRFSFLFPIYDDLTVYAKWEADSNEGDEDTSYIVTFVLNDGSDGTYDVQTVRSNDRADKPQDPEREGFNFAGWFLEPSTVNEFSFTTRIHDDLILYAGWTTSSSTGGVSTTESGGGTIFSITNIDVEDDTATATINVNEESILVVRFYDENTEALIGTISALTPEYCEMEEVNITIDISLPEHFVVTADLYSFEEEQLCNTFRSIKYTSNYEAFQRLTVNDFEGRTVLNFDDDPTNNFGVLNDSVILVNQTENKNKLVQEVTELEDGSDLYSYTFSNTDEQVESLSVNDVVYAIDKNGNGCLFKIGGIETSLEAITFTTAGENELTDYYDVLKVDMRIHNDDSTAQNSGRQGERRKIEVIDAEAHPSAEFSPLNLEWNITDWLKLSGVAKAKVSVDVEITYDARLFRKDYFFMSFKNTTDLEASIKLTAHTENDDEADAAMHRKFEKKFDFAKLRIPTPVPGLAVKVDAGVPVELSAEGSVEISYTTENVSGFTYATDTGRQPYDKKERTFDVKAEGKAELKVGPKLEVGIAFLETVVEAKVEAQAGFVATATATLEIVNATNAESKHGCALCVSVEPRWFVEVSAKLTYEILEDVLSGQVFEVKLVDVEGQIKFGGFPNVYFSIIHSADSVFGTIAPKFGFGDCPNKKYRTTIRLTDDDGHEITGNNVTVYKANNEVFSSKNSTYVDYLYDGRYTVKTSIDGADIAKSIVVSGAAQEINLKKTSGDGSISGKIESSDNNTPVSGATILVKQGALVVASLSSDSNGEYNVNLPDGTYCIRITKDGYIPFSEYVIVKDATNTYVQTALMISSSSQKGGFSGKIVDAVSGNPVKDVTLKIYNGWNNRGYDDYVTTLKTDSNGIFKYDIKKLFNLIIGLPCGNYSAVISKNGYTTTYSNLMIKPGEVTGHPDIAISPLTTGDYRIILSWGASPRDLDSHFNATLTNGGSDHIYYQNKNGHSGHLDKDDTQGYGYETITVTSFDSLSNGFTYTVHDYTNRSYSNSTALSSSGAIVQLYDGNTLLETFNVPTNKVGTAWRVFTVDASGNITPLNTFYSQSTPAYVD